MSKALSGGLLGTAVSPVPELPNLLRKFSPPWVQRELDLHTLFGIQDSQRALLQAFTIVLTFLAHEYLVRSSTERKEMLDQGQDSQYDQNDTSLI